WTSRWDRSPEDGRAALHPRRGRRPDSPPGRDRGAGEGALPPGRRAPAPPRRGAGADPGVRRRADRSPRLEGAGRAAGRAGHRGARGPRRDHRAGRGAQGPRDGAGGLSRPGRERDGEPLLEARRDGGGVLARARRGLRPAEAAAMTYRAVLFDLFDTLVVFDRSRLPELTVNGKVMRSTAGKLHEAFRSFAPRVELGEFVNALQWSWQEAE